MMGEIKVALKKEVKTEGDQLVLEVLQCRNITYKFKSPDHLPGQCVCVRVCACVHVPVCVYVCVYVSVSDKHIIDTEHVCAS